MKPYFLLGDRYSEQPRQWSSSSSSSSYNKNQYRYDEDQRYGKSYKDEPDESHESTKTYVDIIFVSQPIILCIILIMTFW